MSVNTLVTQEPDGWVALCLDCIDSGGCALELGTALNKAGAIAIAEAHVIEDHKRARHCLACKC